MPQIGLPLGEAREARHEPLHALIRSDDEEVTVAFPDKGVKRLMAGFAGLAKR